MTTKGTLPRIISTISSIIIISSALAGCGGGTTGDNSGGGGGGGTSASLVSISVTPAAPTIGLGDTQLFTATGTYSDSATKDLTTSASWSSSDTNVASISNTGLATPAAAGPTTITATLGSISGSATMTVTQAATTSVSLPKTGQTISYAAGDDGDLKKGVDWPSTRFTVTGDCVIDTLTGLMWVKSPGASTMTWEGALSYVNGLNNNTKPCGFDDWRLPNVNELESLYNAGEPYSTDWLNTQGFRTVPEDIAWSSTTHASNPNYAWSVVMWNGDVDIFPKTIPFYIWPVRTAQAGVIRLPKTGQTMPYGPGDDGQLQAGVSWPDIRFTATADCVTDDLTGLMWVKAPDSTLRTWEEALDYVASMNAGTKPNFGYSDWRLPNRKELRSLINYGETNPVTYLNGQSFSKVQTISYWSSTTYAFDPANDTGLAWPAIMVDGSLVEAYKYNYDGAAWPVRGGQ